MTMPYLKAKPQWAAVLALRAVAVALALVLAVALGGCSVTRTTPERQAYLVSASRPNPHAPPAQGASITVATFGVSASYRGKALVYRTSELAYQSDFYNEYFVSPNQMITDGVAAWLASSGKFKNVIRPGTGVDGDLLLNGFVTELYGDYRVSGQAAAVIAVQFFVTDLRAPIGAVVLSTELKARVPLRDRTASSLVAGLSEAFRQVLSELEGQLGNIKPSATAADVGLSELPGLAMKGERGGSP